MFLQLGTRYAITILALCKEILESGKFTSRNPKSTSTNLEFTIGNPEFTTTNLESTFGNPESTIVQEVNNSIIFFLDRDVPPVLRDYIPEAL